MMTKDTNECPSSGASMCTECWDLECRALNNVPGTKRIKLRTIYQGPDGPDGYSFLISGVVIDLSRYEMCPERFINKKVFHAVLDICTVYHCGNTESPVLYRVSIQPAYLNGEIVYGEGYCEEERKWITSWVLELYNREIPALPASEEEATQMAIDHAKVYLDLIA